MLGKKDKKLIKMEKSTTKSKSLVKKKSADNSEIFLIIFLMLIIVVVPLAITIWDIGSPIPGQQAS